jgi:hypothetical protein
MKKLICLLLFAALGGAVHAQEKLTANTLTLGAGQKSEPASIEDMAWYAGQWCGNGLGGLNEEIWSIPRAGVMMGMYRLIKDGKPVFYELLTMLEEKGSLVIRLKHFHPDLKGWEEREESEEFAFVARRDGRMYFDGMTIERSGADAVTVYLAIEHKDGKVTEESFRYTRQCPSAGS